jgi:hypothetical protein
MLAGLATGFKVVLDFLNPSKASHFFLAVLSFLLFLAFAYGGLMAVVWVGVGG